MGLHHPVTTVRSNTPKHKHANINPHIHACTHTHAYAGTKHDHGNDGKISATSAEGLISIAPSLNYQVWGGEKAHEKERERVYTYIYLCLCPYVYIYIYVYR